MVVPRMRFGYSSFSDQKLIEKGRNIKEKIVDNANFTSIKSHCDDFVTGYDDFVAAVPPRNVRDPELTEKKKQKREILLLTMRSLGHAVMSVAKDDPAVILSAGFELVGPRETMKVPETPETIEAFVTNLSGSIVAKCKANKHTKIYKARVSLDQENWEWDGENSTTNVLVERLPLGKILYVQMAQKNSLGESGWSKATSVRLPELNEPEFKKVNVKRIK